MKMGVCNRLRGSVSWIPASAGMTEEVQEKLLPRVWGCPQDS